MAKLDDTKAQPVTVGDLRPGGNAMMQLLTYVERYERLQEERDALGDDQSEVMAEAKGVGFDTKIIRTVIRRRKMDAADRQEADALLETYEEAVRQAEKQAVAKSEAEGSGPKESPQAPSQPRRPWGKKPTTGVLPPAQMDVEELAPSQQDVQAEAARQIAHAADHPEKPDVGNIPSFLRRHKNED